MVQDPNKELELECRRRINIAVRHLIARFPTFAMLLIEKLQFVVDYQFPSCWVNARNLGYNPTWMQGKTLDEIVFIICHEILHCVLFHPMRRGFRDHYLWNVACDYVVNAILVEQYIGKLPKGCLYDPRFNGLSAEEVYEILKNEIGTSQKPEAQGSQPGGEGGSDEGKKDKAKELADSQKDITGEVHDIPGAMPEEAEDLDAEDGDEVRFTSMDYEYNPDDSSVDIEIAEDEQQSWEEALTRAVTVGSKSCGDESVKLGKAVKAARKPPVDVVEELTEFMTQPTRSDPDWMKPRRRLLAISPTFWVPGKGGMQCGDLVSGLDESGSVGDWEFIRLCAIQTDIMERHPADDVRLWLVHFDSSVSCVEVFTKADLPISYERKSCGGTNFHSVTQWVNDRAEEDEDFNPECLIYCTDMYAQPPETQEYPMLWVSTVFHDPRYVRDFPGDKLYFPPDLR